MTVEEKNKKLQMLNSICKNTLMETLAIEYIDFGDDFLKAQMPVNSRVHQPMGLLHGGASVALAESVGSAASIMLVDIKKNEIRGIEIAANHLRSKKEGMVYATAKIVHKGRTLHLWEVRITDEEDRLISLCKISNIILPKSKE